jgi:hypothetical protein
MPFHRVHSDDVLGREAVGEDLLGQRVFDLLLDGPLERPRAIGRV